MAESTIATQCCIAGGGPAGMMLGFLLARAGVEVVVLEKHADFFRDVRGTGVDNLGQGLGSHFRNLAST